MKTLTLNKTTTFSKGSTTKYWREVECDPQTVQLKTWSTNHPYYVLIGKVVDSHDKKELGLLMEIHAQDYSFLLKEKIEQGLYSIK